MKIDHIFIFSSNSGEEANELVQFGLSEGSSRIHPGQGTKNRKFYFGNFFLEILWVVNEEEIQSELTRRTKLWERSQFRRNGNSPFGLCLVNSELTDELFQKSEIYQPDFLPKGMSIDILTNEEYPSLPWTFRLPFRGEGKEHNEPIEHQNGIKNLSGVEFEILTEKGGIEFKNYIRKSPIKLKKGNRTHLTLEFDNLSQNKSKEFESLNLTIKY
ncbi:VOC family protein [Marivirga salinae]|uniref:VOC family protein n=1 Tax=Marivirga salinarum TaxID=3059078 RepID=A0AA49GH77_9BACT|nr:VOC family protein [Marivirga sp. BDSF4-3]WKK77058.2 VOC family protein [Marivirga sp. BDSF4-3]